ncbi:MAG: hypothetical protein M1480_03300 [Bacteroidetes bacterium]|nr:hypothetical protein [Bacteroidota bacterium]
MQKTITVSILLITLFVSVFISGCLDVPKNLIMPQWDVDLNIPMINRSYQLSDIIKKQNYIYVDTISPQNIIYQIKSNNYSQSVGVSQFVSATPSSSSPTTTVFADNFMHNLYIQFPDGIQLDSATFSSGLFSYTFQNLSATTDTVFLSIPGITNTNGSTFSLVVPVPAFQTVTTTTPINFANYSYIFPSKKQPSFLKNSIWFIVEVKGALGSQANITLTTSNFEFKDASGYLPSKSLGIKSSAFSLDLGNAADYRDKAYLKNANLDLDAVYNSPAINPFDIQVKNLSIVGIRNNGQKFTLTIPDSAQTFIFSGNSKHFSFNQDNSNIDSLISFLPDSIKVSAQYVMNPNNTTGSVTEFDSVKFSANFSTTSIMALRRSTMHDSSDINISDENTRTKIKAAQSAYFTVNIQNGIPLDASIRVTLTDSLWNPLFTLTNSTNNSDSIFVDAASVDQNGEVTNQTPTMLEVQLDSTQTEMLSRSYHVKYTVTVETTNASQNPPPTVAVRPDDLIKIQVYGGVKFRVNNDNLK